MTATNSKGKWMVLVLWLALTLFALYSSGEPQGATILTNVTEAQPTTTPANRSDNGGTITVLTMDIVQQNNAWKAYVGNISGRLTLDDASGNTIFDWAIATANIQGEVYVTRNNTVNWNNITCANSTTIINEQNAMSMATTDVDSINNTFNYTLHRSMQVGVNTILNSTCRSTATYINDTRQPSLGNVSLNSTFEEILLQDNNTALVYATFIDQDEFNYKNQTNETYDFQLLVADDDQDVTGTTYYFYLEIGS